MHIIDKPRLVARETYESLINKIAQTLGKREEVESIYQVGSIRHPGISDLDLVCVFKEASVIDINIRQNLNEDERYILTHDLFSVGKNRLEDSFKYSFYTGHKLVSGQELEIPKDPTSLINETLKRQIALEFMLKMYISMYTQITYRTIKLRAFLLEAKAIAFDLELLGITEHTLANQVIQVNQWRDDWFKKPPAKNQIIHLFKSFFASLDKVLSTEMGSKPFYLPYDETAISKNIMISSGKQFKMSHKGVPLLSFLPFVNRKLLNLQNRFNTFHLEAPYSTEFQGSVHEKRFLFYEQIWNENKRLHSHFIPLATGIRLWKPQDFH